MERGTIRALGWILALSLLAPVVGEASGGHGGGGHGAGVHTYRAHSSRFRSHAYQLHGYANGRRAGGRHSNSHRAGRWHYSGRSRSPYQGFGFGLSAFWDAVRSTARGSR